jgi:hypothetical protein
VSGERTTSTSFMSGTGLKKCRPTKRVGRFVVAAISVMESDEVLEAKIARGGRRVEGLEDLALDVEALRHDLDDEVALRSSRGRSCPAGGPAPRLALGRDLALLDALGQEALDLAEALLQEPSSTSRTTTCSPASAHTCAMPEPISPHPTTPTVLMSIALVRASSLSMIIAMPWPPPMQAVARP